MKITKKQPLRPRGRSEDKRQSTKNVIRDAYINGPQKEVQIIPAKRDMEAETEKKKLRVCAYCRVSTDEDTQASSYELQVQNYTRMIRENPEWEFAGIFADEGISGTSVLHREHFLEMIEKCKAGEIDLIITKQVSRFARNVLDSLNYIFMLRKLDPPVGVYFETEKLNNNSTDYVIISDVDGISTGIQNVNLKAWNAKAVKALDEQRKAGELPAEIARVYDDLKKLGYAPDAANTNIGSAIFANKPGDGSAREQAASCQRVLGGAANFACEYATKRYRSNCINWGMLPFLVENPGALDNGDYVYLPGVRKALLEAADELDAVAVKPDGGLVKFTVKLGAMTDAERRILADGCLINYYKNN